MFEAYNGAIRSTNKLLQHQTLLFSHSIVINLSGTDIFRIIESHCSLTADNWRHVTNTIDLIFVSILQISWNRARFWHEEILFLELLGCLLLYCLFWNCQISQYSQIWSVYSMYGHDMYCNLKMAQWIRMTRIYHRIKIGICHFFHVFYVLHFHIIIKYFIQNKSCRWECKLLKE